jgi:hypothetical protein
MKHLGETWIEEFELFLQSSFELCSNFVRTLFELFFKKSLNFCSKNFELFRIVRKRKTFWNLFDFCQIFQFFEKKLPRGPFTDCCHFLNITIEDANVVPQSLWPLHSLIHGIQQNIKMAHDLKRIAASQTDSWRLLICNLFSMKTHLLHMKTSEESLRVLFFTCSLTVDLVH